MSFQEEKEKFLNMPVEEKREYYSCKSYVTLDKVQTWQQFYKENKDEIAKPKDPTEYDAVSEELNNKVSIWFGDITSLEIDAVVNAANKALCGGSGVDGAIHKGAGTTLLKECQSLKGCPTGEAKLAGGYKLPAKYVILTVGPMDKKASMLTSCYEKSLDLALANNFRSIAFPCISTGIYGYPREEAANIAISTTRKFLEKNATKVDRIIFCLFLEDDKEVYKNLMQKYFPVSTNE